jgi:uncharacterized paraquat-inducible protein A
MSPQGFTEKCHRCLQPVPIRASRCPHCGDRLRTGIRRTSLYLAMLGLVVLCGVMGLAWYFSPEPSIDTDGAQQQSTPAPPPKKPPLN